MLCFVFRFPAYLTRHMRQTRVIPVLILLLYRNKELPLNQAHYESRDTIGPILSDIRVGYTACAAVNLNVL